MKLDIVNTNNEKVGALELNDDVFGGRVKTDLIWESVVQQNAAERRGTHKTKNRAAVSGSGKKPWRQKGTGRARVGEIRNPIWRKGGTVFGPTAAQLRVRPAEEGARGALRAAIAQKLQDGAVVVVEAFDGGEGKTRAAAELFRRLGVSGKTLVIDVQLDETFTRAARNLVGVKLVPSARVTARDVMDTAHVVATRGAIEKLQEAGLMANGKWQMPNGKCQMFPGHHPGPFGIWHLPFAIDTDAGMKLTDVIRRPLITEKTTLLREDGRTIVFEVAVGATKVEVKQAVEKLLGSKVAGVRTSIAHGKFKRQGRFIGQRSDWKKAYVKLKDGEKIPEFLEGA
jgi:large subunit ribosomal protein L4